MIKVLDANGWLGSKSYTYIHNINDNGFNAGSDSITSAEMELLFLDILGGKENLTIAVGLSQTETESNLTDHWFTEVEFGLNAQSIVDLLDGIITTTITATKGSFTFKQSELEVKYVPNGRVPEPATLAMLGIGLIGFAAARRKSAKSNKA
jgi:hypothetical protein